MAETKVTQNELADDTVGSWSSWTPTVTGFSVNPSGVYRWKRIGKIVTCSGTQTTNGTSNSTTFTISLPVAAATVTNMRWVNPCPVVDNGTSSVGRIDVASGASVAEFYKDAGGNAFTASGNKRTLGFTIIYEAA